VKFLLLGAILLWYSCATFGECSLLSVREESDRWTSVVEEGRRSLVFMCKVPQVHFDTLQLSGHMYVLPRIAGAGQETRPGYPNVPVKSLIIGIPPGSMPVVRILSESYVEYHGIDIVPVIKFDVESSRQASTRAKETELSPSPIYDMNSYYPASILSGPQNNSVWWLRYQQVMELEIYPIQFNPASKTIRVYREIKLEVEYGSEGTALIAVPTDRFFENVYASVLLNYDQAKRWRSRPPRQNLGAQNKGRDRLSSGNLWYKFVINRDGIYEITYDALVNVGVSPRLISPTQFHIYNGGGKALSTDLSSPEPSLREVATYFDDANHDGRFDPGDRILFYATGTSGWQMDSGAGRPTHYINYFTNDNVYWLVVGGGNRKCMAELNIRPAAGDSITNVEQFLDYYYREDESVYPDYQFFSGGNWYWDALIQGNIKSYTLDLPDPIPGDTADIFIHFKGWSEIPHPITVSVNGSPLFSAEVDYAREQTASYSFVSALLDGPNQLGLLLNPSAVVGANLVYLDWVELYYWRSMRAQDNSLLFRSPKTGGYYRYIVKNFLADRIFVFDVTDPFNVRILTSYSIDYDHGILSILDSASKGSNHQILATSSESIVSVGTLQPAPNPTEGLRDTLNSADYLVITNESLMGNALNRLVAHLQEPSPWRNGNIPAVKVVNVQDIYDEFSWGLFDPTAIRNFLRYTYLHWTTAPTYVLFVGGASFDYKNNSGNSLPNLIPTYEDPDVATDDWFAYLTRDGVMDMIIGRLPAHSQNELSAMVTKVIDYDDNPVYGAWKNRIVMVADDEYSPGGDINVDKLFTIYSEDIVHTSLPSSFLVDKVYLMAYPARDVQGNKPAARSAFLSGYASGALIVNFLGHGNYQQLCNETLFYAPTDLSSLTNGPKLPVFIAGTCEAGRFDGNTQGRRCMAELMLAKPDGGCIASVAATRWELSTANYEIDKSFLQEILARDASTPKSFGEALLIAKMNNIRYTAFARLINLLGVPSQYIARPKGELVLKSIPDTLSVGSTLHLSGVVYNGADVDSLFRGLSEVMVFDSDHQLFEPAVSITYTMPGRCLLDQVWNIQSGILDSTFVISRDSVFGGKDGKIVVYAWGKNGAVPFDVNGSADSLDVVRTVTSVSGHSAAGPIIDILVNGQPAGLLKGAVGLEPTLQITFVDKTSGISFAPQYSPQLYVDDDKESINLAPYFKGNANEGIVTYTLSGLLPGEHTVKISAWNRDLNMTEERLNLVIGAVQMLTDLYTYPDPAGTRMSFWFNLAQNADIKINVFTLSGRLVKVFNFYGRAGLNVYPQESWDLRDEDGDPLPNGVYLFKVIARPFDDSPSEAIGKFAILR